MNSVKRKFALALSKRIGADIALASHKDASLEDFTVKVVVKDGNGSTSSSLCARAFFQEFGEAKKDRLRGPRKVLSQMQWRAMTLLFIGRLAPT